MAQTTTHGPPMIHVQDIVTMSVMAIRRITTNVIVWYIAARSNGPSMSDVSWFNFLVTYFLYTRLYHYDRSILTYLGKYLCSQVQLYDRLWRHIVKNELCAVVLTWSTQWIQRGPREEVVFTSYIIMLALALSWDKLLFIQIG